jgi:hypothetical protein
VVFVRENLHNLPRSRSDGGKHRDESAVDPATARQGPCSPAHGRGDGPALASIQFGAFKGTTAGAFHQGPADALDAYPELHKRSRHFGVSTKQPVRPAA